MRNTREREEEIVRLAEALAVSPFGAMHVLTVARGGVPGRAMPLDHGGVVPINPQTRTMRCYEFAAELIAERRRRLDPYDQAAEDQKILEEARAYRSGVS